MTVILGPTFVEDNRLPFVRKSAQSMHCAHAPYVTTE